MLPVLPVWLALSGTGALALFPATAPLAAPRHLRARPVTARLNVPEEGVLPGAPVAGTLEDKPRWRGQLHLGGAMIFPLMSLELCRAGCASVGGLTKALMFSAGVEGIMAISGIMHTTNWRLLQPVAARGVPDTKVFHPQWIRLLDYSMIFLGIALLVSSLGGLILGQTLIFQQVIAPIVWGTAVVGISSKTLFINNPRCTDAKRAPPRPKTRAHERARVRAHPLRVCTRKPLVTP